MVSLFLPCWGRGSRHMNSFIYSHLFFSKQFELWQLLLGVMLHIFSMFFVFVQILYMNCINIQVVFIQLLFDTFVYLLFIYVNMYAKQQQQQRQKIQQFYSSVFEFCENFNDTLNYFNLFFVYLVFIYFLLFLKKIYE